MWSIALLFAFLSVTAAKNEFPNEVIVTSADLVNGQVKNIGKAGESYRMYGCGQTERTLLPNDLLYKGITITDSKNTQFSLMDLMEPAASGSYFLSDQKTVIGPISVSNAHLAGLSLARSTGLPFTIYLVSTKVDPLPVTTALAWAAEVPRDSDQYSGQPARGITILSGDAFFTLRHFNITTDSAYIIPRGFDIQSSSQKDSLIDLTIVNAFSSHLTIFGPIATIISSDQTGRFQFGFDVTSSQTETLQAGSSVTLLSPNLLSLDESYSTSYTSYREAFLRQFDFERDTLINFELSASSVRGGDSVTLEISNEDGVVKQWKYDPSSKDVTRDNLFGNSINFKANVAALGSPETYPRFIVKVTSGATASAFVASILIPLILMLW